MCIFFLVTPAFLGNSFSMNSGVCQALPLRAVWESLICSFVQQRFCGQCGEWDRGTYWGEVGGRPPLLPSWGTLEVLGSGRLGINQGLWPPLVSLREALDSGVWVFVLSLQLRFPVSLLWPPSRFRSEMHVCWCFCLSIFQLGSCHFLPRILSLCW